MAEAGEQKNSGKNVSEVKTAWWQPAINMFLKLSVWIAGPVIIALYLGKWLDERYNSAPWLFLVCIGAAFGFSLFGLLRITARELKKLEKK